MKTFDVRNRFKLLLTFHVLIGSCLPILGQVYISDAEDLQHAVNAANPGDEFIVPNGSYHDFEASFTAVATKEAPIIVRAETIGGVTLTGESHFTFKKAAHIILQGFIIDGQGENTLVKLEGSHHIRITRNVFELETNEPIKWIYIGGVWNDHTFQYLSHHNRVDYNTFQNKATPGHYITIDGTYNEDDTDIRQSQFDRIDHNYFRNNSPRAANEQESIRIGWSEMSQASGYTTVEFNLFEDCDGDPEIISVKSCDNIIRHNTFRKSYGTLSLRHGNRNRVEGNYFFGDGKANGTFTHSNGNTQTLYTGGIRIYGTDHVIVNNYMEGLQGTIWDAPIALTQGDAVEGSSTNYSKHFRAERITIAYNTLVNNAHGIEIGYDKNGEYSKGLTDIFISNNLITGSENSLVSYLDGNTQGDEIEWYNNILFPTGNATVTSDGSDFDSSEAKIIDPMLVFDGVIWQATSSSPLLDRGMASLDILEDIDGQSRPSLSTVGADHYSMELVRFAPLTPQDVGPQSTVTTSIDGKQTRTMSIQMYPNPNSGFFTLSHLPPGESKLRIFTMAGEILIEQDLSGGDDLKHEISLPDLPNGYYLFHISANGQSQVKQLIIRE